MKAKVILKPILLILILAGIGLTIALVLNLTKDPSSFIANPFYDIVTTRDIRNLIQQIVVFTVIFFIIITYVNKQKEDRYSHFDMIPQTILMYNALGKITFVNRFGCEKYKVDRIKIVGASIMDFLLESDRPRAIADTTAYVKGGITEETIGSAALYKKNYAMNNYTTLTSDGEEIDTTVYVGKSGLLHLLCIMVDNVDKIESESQLEDTTEFFWGLLDNMPMPVTYNDASGSFKYVNSAYRKLTGKTDADILGRKMADILDARDIDSAEQRRLYVVNNKDSVSYETQSYADSKDIKTLQINIVPRLIDGEVDGTFGTIQDITDKKTKDRLLKKEILLNKTLNQISEKISSANPSDIIKTTNESLFIMRQVLNVCRAYILTSIDGEFTITGEDTDDKLKPYLGATLDMPTNHKSFYEKLAESGKTVKSDTVSISKFAHIKHLKIFKAKSFAEVSIPATNAIENNTIIGVCTVDSIHKWTPSELEFLSGAGRLIISAIDRVKKINELRLSEETLNTLIDNTDIGIIISNITGSIYYQNTRFIEMFGELTSNNHMSVINRIVSKNDNDKALKLFGDREYKGYASGTIKAVTKEKIEIFAKIYSSRIDYEGSKAYLTTVVDVSEYMINEEL